MAYYNKKQVIEYINVNCQKIKEEGLIPITNPQEPLKKISDEQDVIGFFWIEMKSGGENSLGINMEGKIFIRISPDLFTDDRYAIDSYQAAEKGITVSEMILEREKEQEEAKKTLNPEIMDRLKEFMQSNNKK